MSSQTRNETYTLQTRGDMPAKLHLTLDLDASGVPVAISVATMKVGSPLRVAYEAWAATATVALQHGAQLSEVAEVLRGAQDGTTRWVDLPDGDRVPARSMWDAIAALLARALGASV